MTLQVTVDPSFLEEVLTYFQQPSNNQFSKLMKHPAAQLVHAHATAWQNTNADLSTFWKEIFEKEQDKGPEYYSHLQGALDYLELNRQPLDKALNDVQDYLPSSLQLESHLYLMLGYDIGIVSQGDALLNLGHPLFQRDLRELIFFAMHEVHHAGFTHIHPMFTLEGMQTLDDLGDSIQYSTQLEGLAVYAALRGRLNEQVLTHEDYSVLLNPEECEKRVQRFFDIYNNLVTTPNRPLQQRDFELFEIMSRPHQRLWYITGAHMARAIDTQMGRDTLLQTVTSGPESFFLTYGQIQDVL